MKKLWIDCVASSPVDTIGWTVGARESSREMKMTTASQNRDSFIYLTHSVIKTKCLHLDSFFCVSELQLMSSYIIRNIVIKKKFPQVPVSCSPVKMLSFNATGLMSLVPNAIASHVLLLQNVIYFILQLLKSIWTWTF